MQPQGPGLQVLDDRQSLSVATLNSSAGRLGGGPGSIRLAVRAKSRPRPSSRLGWKMCSLRLLCSTLGPANDLGPLAITS